MSRRKRTFSRATLFRRGFLAVTVVLSWGAAAPVFAANLENLDLSQLVADKAYEFLFAWSPLKIKGGTGSPGNPIAMY